MLWISMSVIGTNHAQCIIDEIINFYRFLIFVLHLKWIFVCHWLLSLVATNVIPRLPFLEKSYFFFIFFWLACVNLGLDVWCPRLTFLLSILSYSCCHLRVLRINPFSVLWSRAVKWLYPCNRYQCIAFSLMFKCWIGHTLQAWLDCWTWWSNRLEMKSSAFSVESWKWLLLGLMLHFSGLL